MRDAGVLLLHAQGLSGDPDIAATPAVLAARIRDMGFVQIDTINIVERAHHLTLHSRLHRYRHEHLAQLLEQDRSLFEHWTHDASAIPTEFFAHWRPRFERSKQRIRQSAWWRARLGRGANRILAQVREKVASDGPVLSRDFEHARAGEPPVEDGWWGWKPQKAALEFLWRTGELAVVKRINFQKVYDLTERVLPEHHALPAPTVADHVDWACRSALERLVIATPTELANFWHAISIAQAKQWAAAAVKRGSIVAVNLLERDGVQRPALALPDWDEQLFDAKQAVSEAEHVRLVSPFDPVIRDRKRAMRLFGFDYRFEAFVPAPQRQFGYFVMPLLKGDQFVGRLDPKFHRDRGVLEIRGLWLEPHVRRTGRLTAEIEAAVARLAEFIGAASFTLPKF